MALSTFITGSMAASMTDMVKHLLRVGLDKLAAEGKLIGTVDEAMDLLDAVEVKEPVLEQAHLWWTGEVVEDNCKAICRAEGRMLQCPLKASGGDFCKKCARQISTKGKLSFGTVEDRLACDPLDYPGVKPYEVYAKRHNITDEQITQAEEVYGFKCPRADKKRGRPQKAKKAAPVDELTIAEEVAEVPDQSEVEVPVQSEVAVPVQSEIEVPVQSEVEPPKAEDKPKEKKPRAKKDKSEKTESDSEGEAKPKKEKKAKKSESDSDEPKEVKEKKPKAKKEKAESDSDGEKEKEKKPKAKAEPKPKKEKAKKEAEPEPVKAADSEDELEVEEWSHPLTGKKYLKSTTTNDLYTEDGEKIGTWNEMLEEIV